MFCIKCGIKNPDVAEFCIKCGHKLPIVNSSNRIYRNTSVTPGSGCLPGCLTGMSGGCVGGVLILAGILLCFTGIGAIIGIPLIIFGISSIFMGPFIGYLGGKLPVIRGSCPYCDTVVIASPLDQGVTCPACNKRIVIKNGAYFRVD